LGTNTEPTPVLVPGPGLAAEALPPWRAGRPRGLANDPVTTAGPETPAGRECLMMVRGSRAPGVEMANDRPRSRRVRTAALLSAVVLGALVAWGAGQWVTRSGEGPTGPAPTTRPASVLPATSAPAPSAVAPTTAKQPPTTAPATTGVPLAGVRLRPDGLGVAAFGAAEREALDRLSRHLGAPDERGSWSGATPFGTCPGPTRAVRWGRLYVLFTNGPTRYVAGGRWHLFAYQVDAIQRTKVDPGYSGPSPPPDPPPLRGYSPRTLAGIGFGSTLAQVRAAYGRRVEVTFGEPGVIHRVRVGFGAGDLWGSLSGGTPRSTVTGLAAGAICGE
jgi:hypothetical protein